MLTYTRMGSMIQIDNEMIKRWNNAMQYDARVTARMKKIEGQLRGILRMMDEEKDCKDVITQLSAVRSAVDRTIGVIVTDNLVDCLSKEDAASIDKNIMVKQAVELLVKSR